MQSLSVEGAKKLQATFSKAREKRNKHSTYYVARGKAGQSDLVELLKNTFLRGTCAALPQLWLRIGHQHS